MYGYMEKILLVDAEKCSGCDLCALACSLVKRSIFNPFKGRIRVIRCLEKEISVPMICEHCIDPPCEKTCPTGAIKRGSDGIISINEDECTGCRMCLLACPFGALTMDLEKRVAVKCDLCDGKPLCAAICPTDAITYVEKTPENLQKKREVMAKNYEIRRQLPNLYQILGAE